MVDYIPKYLTDEGFDIPRLLNDDFLLAIKLLFQNGFYVSSTKLLVSFIDSLGFVEYGDNAGNTFIRWLNAYVDLGQVNVTAEELWEHRNSLLHMTNLDSRHVIAGRVKRLICYVGELPKDFPTEDANAKYFDLRRLIMVTIEGLPRWLMSFNRDQGKLEVFMNRYDLVVSDSRRLEMALGDNVTAPQ